MCLLQSPKCQMNLHSLFYTSSSVHTAYHQSNRMMLCAQSAPYWGCANLLDHGLDHEQMLLARFMCSQSTSFIPHKAQRVCQVHFCTRPEKAANGRRRKKLRILELPESDLTFTWQCDLVTSGGEAQAPAPVDCWRNCA